MEKIKVYGTRWCGDTKRALRILDEREIDYDWIDIDKDTAGEKLVKETNNGNRSVPTIFFPDGDILVEPRNQALKDKLDQIGSHTNQEIIP
jgi:glutaredoxin